MNERDTSLERLDGAGPLPFAARKALWDRLWLRLLAPPLVVDVCPASHMDEPADLTAGREAPEMERHGPPPLRRRTRKDAARG